MGRILVIVALLAVLAGAVWFAAASWTAFDGGAMPTEGYVAMGVGVLFSLVVGVGLMALVFYSHRHGYDEPAQRDRDRRDT